MSLRTMKINIVGARVLATQEVGRCKQPLCECFVESKPDAKVRTSLAADTAQPIWNYEAEFHDVDVSKDTLAFSLYRCEAGAHDLGQAAEVLISKGELPAAHFFPAAFEGEVELPGAGPYGGKAFLVVAARAVEPGEELSTDAGSVPAGKDMRLVSDEEVKAVMEAGVDKELEARAHTRAYYLWENGSTKGAEADYFEALRTELSQLSPEVVRPFAQPAAGGA
uniref:C2 domain-containing protein n=1 Tax=Alexandrium monilatum TaxID=311494 RepID=A0A7S4W3U8_9DINO